MKKYLVLAMIFGSLQQASALTWKVFGPCSETPVFEGSFEADLNKSVGDISIQIFEANKVPYVGVSAGFNSINNSPLGLDAVEVVADNEMRAYGWCYVLNGKIPKVMPDKIKPQSQKDSLFWFYGYSTNKNNQWQDDYCTPGYEIKADQFCEK